MTYRLWKISISLLVAFLFVGCSGEAGNAGGDGDSDPEPVDSAQFRADLDENVERVGRAAATGLKLLDEARTLEDYADRLELEGRFCETPVADAWSRFSPPWNSNWGSFENRCDRRFGRARTRVDLNDLVDQFLSGISPQVFADSNLEEALENSLYYFVDGAATCSSSGCANWVDDAELGLFITSPRQRDYDVSMQFGSSRSEIVMVEVYRERLAAIVELSLLDEVIDEGDLPELLDGQIRVGVDISQGPPVLFVDVLRELRVGIDDVEILVGSGNRVFELAVDDPSGDVTVTVNLQSLSVQFVDPSVDPVAGATESVMRLEIPSGYAEVIFEEQPAQVQLNGLHFGGEGAQLYFDDTLEASLKLNADEGEQFRSTMTWNDGEFAYRVRPTFDTALDMKFQRIRRLGVDIREWMTDESISVRFADAAEPLLVYSQELLQVIDGELSLESEATGESFRISEGQCLSGGGNTTNPFDSFVVRACP